MIVMVLTHFSFSVHLLKLIKTAGSKRMVMIQVRLKPSSKTLRVLGKFFCLLIFFSLAHGFWCLETFHYNFPHILGSKVIFFFMDQASV